MAKTPTARTLAYLRDAGYLAEVVERRLPRCIVTVDLFNIADVFALMPNEPPLLVQCTTGSNAAARVKKILAAPHLRKVLASGVAVEVWAWSKRGAHGKRKLWDVTRRPVTVADLDATGQDGNQGNDDDVRGT